MQRWLIFGAIALAIALIWWMLRARSRRRQKWFDSLASAYGVKAGHPSDTDSAFAIDDDGRRTEVAYRYLSASFGASASVGWRLIVTVPLRNVSDLYSLQLSCDGKADVTVRDSGYKPREGWLDDPVRDAVTSFFEASPGTEPLDIGAARLVSRTPGRIDAARLREIVARQQAVAAALERVL